MSPQGLGEAVPSRTRIVLPVNKKWHHDDHPLKLVTWAYIFLAQSLTPVYCAPPARLEFCSWNLVLIRSRGCIIITSIHPDNMFMASLCIKLKDLNLSLTYYSICTYLQNHRQWAEKLHSLPYFAPFSPPFCFGNNLVTLATLEKSRLLCVEIPTLHATESTTHYTDSQWSVCYV